METETEEYYFPNLVLRKIFQYLGSRDVWAASQTCGRWRAMGQGARRHVREVRISDYYVELINERAFIEFPVFHRRAELEGLVLVRTRIVRKLITWLARLFPNVAELVFRNYVSRRAKWDVHSVPHPSRFHIFIINELMNVVGQQWPQLEMVDVSGEIVDVRSLHHIRRWPRFREVRLSGADLSYNMLVHPRYFVTDALTKTFWKFPMTAMRMSNLEMTFEMKATRMTMFKALNNTSLTTGWLHGMLQEAVNLEHLAIDCKYVHNDSIELIASLVKMKELMLRNCTHVTEFGPLSNLTSLESVTIDFGDKCTEAQLCKIVEGSKKIRRIIFNEIDVEVGDGLLLSVASHVSGHNVPLLELELNTEKTSFAYVDHTWILPKITADGIRMLVESCPLLEVLGLCSDRVDDDVLIEAAENCPRLRSVTVNDSRVTNRGVIEFYETLQRRRMEMYGVDSGSAVVNVKNAQCDRESLLDEAHDKFGGTLKVIV